MGYSFQTDFSLKFAGEEATDFIGNAARTWPGLFHEVKGVSGTLLLSNTLALGGPYEYRWRVDIESLSTLHNLATAFTSDEAGWVRLLGRWFDSRSVVSSRVTEIVAGDDDYAKSGDDALLHVVLRGDNNDDAARRGEELRSKSRSLQIHQTALGAGRSRSESWARVTDFEALEGSGALGGHTQILQEVREIEGGLILGA